MDGRGGVIVVMDVSRHRDIMPSKVLLSVDGGVSDMEDGRSREVVAEES